MNTKYHQTDGFKFNSGGLIGLDAGTAKGISKFLRARERELNTIVTDVITCEGGPFNGQQIELQPNGGLAAPAKSADFTVGAWRGHYLGSKWVSTLTADAPAPEAMAAPLPRPKINCDLPAKGFDQLRDLLGEMSINPLERETTIKTRYKTARFEYGKTDDFGNEILEFSPVGAYACELVQFVTPARGKKTKPAIVYKIKRSNAQHGAMAMDDFGDLFITQPRKNEHEEMIEKRQFLTYKLGRTSYTIPATIEAVERLATKLLKVKKFCSDKMISLGGQPRPAAQVAPMATAPAVQPVAVVINTPPALLPKIKQPAKPLATTCNPDALRLRSKATICRAANRPTWAEKLEAQADALERIEQPEPPEPPPCKHKNKIHRQRPHKTACILLAKIRNPARQKYGQPFRQNFRQPLAERLISNGHEPPGIKSVIPSAINLPTKPRLNPCHAHNSNPATHPPHPCKSKQSAVIYPCQPLPNFAASTWRHGRLGKLDVTACRHPFGGSSTSYWTTLSCRMTIKPSQPGHENQGKRLDVTA